MPGTRRDGEEPTNADLRAVMLEVRDKVNHVHKIITGGDKPEDGLIVQVDRLKQSHKSASRIGWAAITASVGSAVGWFFAHFNGNHIGK